MTKRHVASALGTLVLAAGIGAVSSPAAMADPTSSGCAGSGEIYGYRFDVCLAIYGTRGTRYVDHMDGSTERMSTTYFPHFSGCQTRVRLYYASNGDSMYSAWKSCPNFALHPEEGFHFGRTVPHGKYCDKIQFRKGSTGAVRSTHAACEDVHD